jgi:hypothetical protein
MLDFPDVGRVQGQSLEESIVAHQSEVFRIDL